MIYVLTLTLEDGSVQGLDVTGWTEGEIERVIRSYDRHTRVINATFNYVTK